MGFNTKSIEFNLIVAFDKNRGIGLHGDLPWRIPEEIKHFKNVTTTTEGSEMQNAVIMGRKTWDSIPEKFRPLSNRKNIIVTKSNPSLPGGVLKADSLSGAIWLAALFQTSIERIFVIGGASIYEQAIKMPNCRYIYATEINKAYDCDVFFPKFLDKYKFKFSMLPNNSNYTHCLYERKSE